MKQISVIYWSGTGNTEAMAKAVANGAKQGGAGVKLISVEEATLQDVVESDAVAFGCPSMGAEVLEEIEMEPFIESLQGNINGKKIALFGSYGWGNGEWMLDWEIRMKGYGADLIDDGLIINEMPDGDGIKKCESLGEDLSKSVV